VISAAGADDLDRGVVDVGAAVNLGEDAEQTEAGKLAHDHQVEPAVVGVGLGRDAHAAAEAGQVGDHREHGAAGESAAVVVDPREGRLEGGLRVQHRVDLDQRPAQPLHFLVGESGSR
jgi:hypothetical protein